jgi:hypothetical protein
MAFAKTLPSRPTPIIAIFINKTLANRVYETYNIGLIAETI